MYVLLIQNIKEKRTDLGINLHCLFLWVTSQLDRTKLNFSFDEKIKYLRVSNLVSVQLYAYHFIVKHYFPCHIYSKKMAKITNSFSWN